MEIIILETVAPPPFSYQTFISYTVEVATNAQETYTYPPSNPLELRASPDIMLNWNGVAFSAYISDNIC